MVVIHQSKPSPVQIFKVRFDVKDGASICWHILCRTELKSRCHAACWATHSNTDFFEASLDKAQSHMACESDKAKN